MMETSLIALDEKKPFTDEEIAIFEKKYLASCKQFAEAVKNKKKFAEQEKEIREKLEKAMDEYGIKSLDNEFLKIIRVAENPGKTSTVINLDALKEEEPDLYSDLLKDYPKEVTTGKKKAYVTITAK